MPEWIPLVFLFFFGLAVGSHLNVLVLRFGFEERSSPRSECAQCGARIRWYDLVPVISFLMLRGRCRACGSAIHPQYPVVELALALLFALIFTHLPPPLTLPGIVEFISLLFFAAAAVGIAAYDIRHTLVPLPFAYALIASAFLYRALGAWGAGEWAPLLDAALGALLLGVFFAFLTFVTRGRGMGIGDAYIAAAVGALLGILGGATAVAFGVWSATAAYVLVMMSSWLGLLSRHARVTMKSELPFAPWLLFGALLVLFTGWTILDVSDWISAILSWFTS